MDSFRWGKAWSLGYGFVAGRALAQAIVLVGIGILIPFAAQFALAGGPIARPNPVMTGGALETAAGMGGVLLALTLITYILQTGSYFSAWRLGLDARASLGGALGYGLPAGFLAVLVLAALGILIGGAVYFAGTEGAAILLILALAIPMLAAFAAFFTTLVAAFAVALALLLVLAMVMGAATGNIGMAATMVGGSGTVTVVFLVLCGITLWLAARLCCTTALMADRKSFNLVAALRDSWALTWEEQWSIMRYLALIGLALALIILAAATAIGVGAASFIQQGGSPAPNPAAGLGFALLGVAISIPFAFLTVMVPAGIYRELNPPVVDAGVFA